MTLLLERDWPGAMSALWRLRSNYDDIQATMTVIQNLEGPAFGRCYDRMMASASGRAQISARVELSRRLTDQAWLDTFPAGTLGAVYRDYMRGRRFSARTLVDDLMKGPNGDKIDRAGVGPWFARRITDLHDIAHLLTGYEAGDPQGEGCVVAWTFAQLGAWGYAAIAIGSAMIFGPAPVIEAYKAGRRAKWLFDIDLEQAFAEPIEQVRARLRITLPRQYRSRKQRRGQ